MLLVFLDNNDGFYAQADLEETLMPYFEYTTESQFGDFLIDTVLKSTREPRVAQAEPEATFIEATLVCLGRTGDDLSQAS